MKNPVGWFEVYASDISRAKAFYQGVFQVELTQLSNPGIDSTPGLEMWAFPADMDGYGASGAVATMPGIEPGGTGTIVYFSCDDCAVEEKRITEHGGNVLNSKQSIGEHGFITIAKDTEGNMIGLHSMA